MSAQKEAERLDRQLAAESAGGRKQASAGGWHVSAAVVIAATLGLYLVSEYYTPSQPRAATKKFDSFAEFFPFYLTEHSNKVCRALHVVGSTAGLLVFLRYPSLILNAVAAGSVGMLLMPLTAHMEKGFVEFAAMGITFLLLGRRTTGSFKAPLMLMTIGYAFAWVGHFMFEHNKPATFIYPTYSLMGDWTMWYMAVTYQLPVLSL